MGEVYLWNGCFTYVIQCGSKVGCQENTHHCSISQMKMIPIVIEGQAYSVYPGVWHDF